MIYKFLITLLLLQSLPNSKDREFEKNCFAIFIKSLYSRDALSHETKTFFVVFKHLDDERYFTKKVNYQDKVLKIKKGKPRNTADLLTIISISEPINNKITITFISTRGGAKYDGTIVLSIDNNKPIFSDARIIYSIE